MVFQINTPNFEIREILFRYVSHTWPVCPVAPPGSGFAVPGSVTTRFFSSAPWIKRKLV